MSFDVYLGTCVYIPRAIGKILGARTLLPPTSGTIVVNNKSPYLLTSTLTIHSPDRSLVMGEISPKIPPHYGVLAQALNARNQPNRKDKRIMTIHPYPL
jgi:hypothetical protein